MITKNYIFLYYYCAKGHKYWPLPINLGRGVFATLPVNLSLMENSFAFLPVIALSGILSLIFMVLFVSR